MRDKRETRLYEAYGSNVLGAVLGGNGRVPLAAARLPLLLALALLLYLAVLLLLRRSD